MNKVANALGLVLLVPALAGVLGGCGDDDDDPAGPSDGGAGGTSAGAGGAAAGAAGSAAGTAGAGGSAAGSGGSAAGAAGQGGAAGGAAGQGGAGGSAPASSQGFAELKVEGSGFMPHVSHKVLAALVRLPENTTIAVQEVTLVDDDKFSFAWPGVLRPGVSYALDYYADVSGNGQCDAAPADHVWRREIPAFAGESTTLTITHDTNWTDQCATFNGKPARQDVSFKATQFDPHKGGLVMVAVSRADTGDIVARQAVKPVADDGTISVAWKGLAETGVAYNVDYYADVTGEGKCDNPPADHVWRFPVAAVAAPVNVEVIHTSEWGNYCDSFNK